MSCVFSKVDTTVILLSIQKDEKTYRVENNIMPLALDLGKIAKHLVFNFILILANYKKIHTISCKNILGEESQTHYHNYQ